MSAGVPSGASRPLVKQHASAALACRMTWFQTGTAMYWLIDLQSAIHALIRLNPTTGTRETLASQGYIEPQGLVIDAQGNIYVADDYADIIVKYSPA